MLRNTLFHAEEQLEGIARRASAAAAALKGSADEEDRHELETYGQLRTVRALLQAHRRRAHAEASRLPMA